MKRYTAKCAHGAYCNDRSIIAVNKEGVPIKWRSGKKYLLQEKCSLCRCGESKNKPFCDGTHKKINFEGTEVGVGEPYLGLAKITTGPDRSITNPDSCLSSAIAFRTVMKWAGWIKLMREDSATDTEYNHLSPACLYVRLIRGASKKRGWHRILAPSPWTHIRVDFKQISYVVFVSVSGSFHSSRRIL